MVGNDDARRRAAKAVWTREARERERAPPPGAPVVPPAPPDIGPRRIPAALIWAGGFAHKTHKYSKKTAMGGRKGVVFMTPNKLGMNDLIILDLAATHIIQLKFETVIVTNSPINLLSLPVVDVLAYVKTGTQRGVQPASHASIHVHND